MPCSVKFGPGYHIGARKGPRTKIDWKPSHHFRNARIPSRVVNSAVKIVHSSWIRFCFGLLSEDGRIQQDKCDVSYNMVLCFDFVEIA